MPFIPFGSGSDELLYRQMVGDFVSRESASLAMRKTASIGDLLADVFKMPEAAGLATIGEIKNNNAIQVIAQNEHATEMILLNEEHGVELINSSIARGALAASPYALPIMVNNLAMIDAATNYTDMVTTMVSNTGRLTQLLSSPYIVDTLWKKSTSGKVWDRASPVPPATITSLGATSRIAGRQSNGVGMRAEFTVFSGGSTGTVGATLTLDLTNIKEIRFYRMYQNATSCQIRVSIDGSQVHSSTASVSSWGILAVDVGGYSGNCSVSFEIYRSVGSAGSGCYGQFCDIRLIR